MITSLFFVSCGDDDSVNCGKIYEEISDSFDAYDEAYDNGDCEELQSLFDKAMKALRKGKNCENIKEGLQDAGYSSIEELIDEYEEDYADEIADCGQVR